MNEELKNLQDAQNLHSEELKKIEERINQGKKVPVEEMDKLKQSIRKNMKSINKTNEYFMNHIEELFSFLEEIEYLIDEEQNKDKKEQKKCDELIVEIRELIRYRKCQYRMFILSYNWFKILESKNNEL